MPTGAATAAIAGSALGGIIGSQGNQNTTSNTQSTQLAPLSALGQQAQGSVGSTLSGYQGMVDASGNAQTITNGVNAQTDLATLLKQLSANSGFASQGQQGQANDLASQIMAPQQAALNNSFIQQNQNEARTAATLGRPINDPVLQALNAKNQSQQQQVLSGQQTSLAGQLGQQAVQNQANYASASAGITQGLASQALANYQNLLSQGQNILGQAQNMQVSGATRTNNTTNTSGGGLSGALSGALGGAGSLAGGVSTLMNAFKSTGAQDLTKNVSSYGGVTAGSSGVSS